MIQVIHTNDAPQPIGTYSQAVKVGNTVYLSGQIPKNPKTEKMAEGFAAELMQVLDNLNAVAVAAGGSLQQIVKLTLFMIDLNDFSKVNEIMVAYFQKPFPARSTVQVAALPANASIEIEAIMVI
jgi:reactive intermediate/imine deaminase